jgi:hypothetical protein
VALTSEALLPRREVRCQWHHHVLADESTQLVVVHTAHTVHTVHTLLLLHLMSALPGAGYVS